MRQLRSKSYAARSANSVSARFGISRYRQIGTLSGLLSLSLVLWILSPYFLTVSNLLNIAEQTSIIAVVAAGMTFVIIAGGIDLSVGSLLAFSGVVMASSLSAGRSIPLALMTGLAVGLLCGIANGLLISIGRLPPFIATLGMMSIARGGALVFTEGRPISGFSETFRSIATTNVLRVPFPVIVMLGVYILCHLALARTKLGRYAYAIGGNETAALLSGVNVHLYKTMVYGLSGICSALAAVLLTARLNSAQPIAGINYELDAIAAVVVGGTSLMGGEGSVAGTLIGALIIGVLRNGLNLLAVSSFIQQIVIGFVIVIAVLMDTFFKGRGK